MKTIIISLFMAITAIAAHAQQKSFYDFTVKTIDGEDLSLSTFKGKKVLVVNVASKCGFTPQYAKLEELYKKYGKDNFVIIGFPANNFLSQEPGSNEEIKEFCTLNYGVTFPMMAKISVKGKDIAPLYKFRGLLCSISQSILLSSPIADQLWSHRRLSTFHFHLSGIYGNSSQLLHFPRHFRFFR